MECVNILQQSLPNYERIERFPARLKGLSFGTIELTFSLGDRLNAEQRLQENISQH